MIVTKLNHFDTATKQLVSEINAVPALNTSERREAREVDRELTEGAQAQSESAKTVASTIVANGSFAQVVAALAVLPDYGTLKV